MSKFNTALKLFKKDKRLVIAALFNYIVKSGLLNGLSDKVFLKLAYRIYIGFKLDLNDPRGFNEKLQWLKLYYRRPEFVKYVDKYAVKEYVGRIIGDKYLINTLGVWNSFEEIDFNKLP